MGKTAFSSRGNKVHSAGRTNHNQYGESTRTDDRVTREGSEQDGTLLTVGTRPGLLAVLPNRKNDMTDRLLNWLVSFMFLMERIFTPDRVAEREAWIRLCIALDIDPFNPYPERKSNERL